MTATNGYNPTFQLYNSAKGYSEKGVISLERSQELSGLFHDLKFSPLIQQAIRRVAERKNIQLNPIDQGRIEVYESWNGQVQLRYTDAKGSVSLNETDLKGIKPQNEQETTALEIAQRILQINAPQRKVPTGHASSGGLSSIPESDSHTIIHNHSEFPNQPDFGVFLEMFRQMDQQRARDHEITRSMLASNHELLLQTLDMLRQNLFSRRGASPAQDNSALVNQIQQLEQRIRELNELLQKKEQERIPAGVPNSPESSLQHIENETQKLRDYIANLEGELSRLRKENQEIETLKKGVKDLTSERNRIAEELEAAKSALSDANERISKLMQLNNELGIESRDLKSKIALLEKTVETLTHNLTETQAKLATAEERLKKLAEENRQLRERNEFLENANQSIGPLEEENAQQKATLASLQTTLAAQTEKLTDNNGKIQALLARIEELNTALSSKTEELNTALAQNKAHEHTIKSLQSDLEQLRKQLRSAQDQNAPLEELIKKQADELAQNQKTLEAGALATEKTNTENERLQKLIADLERKLELAVAQKSTDDKTIKELRGEVANLQELLKQQKVQIPRLIEENTNLKNENDKLRAALADLDRIKKELTTANRELGDFRDTLIPILKLDDSTNNTQLVSATKRHIEDLNSQIERLNAAVNSKRSHAAQLAELTQKLSSQEQELQKLLQDKKTFDTVTAAINGENKELLARIAELEKVISKNNAQIQSLETELEELKRKAGQDQNEANEKIRNLEQQLEALKIKSLSDQSLIAQLKEENEGLLSNNRKLSETIEEQQAEIQRLRLQIKELSANEAEIQRLDGEVSRLSAELAEIVSQQPKVDSLTQRPSPEVMVLQLRNEELENELRERIEEREKLIADMDALQKDNIRLDAENEAQAESIELLKKEKRPAPPSTEELDKLRAQIIERDQTISKKDQELSESSAGYWRVSASLDAARQQATNDLNAAKAQNEQLQALQQLTADENETLTRKNEQLEETIKEQAKKQKELESELANKDFELHEANSPAHEAQKKAKESQAKLKDTRKHALAHEKRIAELELDLAGKDTELNEVMNASYNLHQTDAAKLREANAEIEKLRNELTRRGRKRTKSLG